MATVLSQIEKCLRDKHVNILGSDIRSIIKIIFSEIFEALYRDEAVEIRRFGRFSTKIRKSRTSRNPRTGVKLLVPSKRVIKWKTSKVLLKRLNKFTENTISVTNKN